MGTDFETSKSQLSELYKAKRFTSTVSSTPRTRQNRNFPSFWDSTAEEKEERERERGRRERKKKEREREREREKKMMMMMRWWDDDFFFVASAFRPVWPGRCDLSFICIPQSIRALDQGGVEPRQAVSPKALRPWTIPLRYSVGWDDEMMMKWWWNDDGNKMMMVRKRIPQEIFKRNSSQTLLGIGIGDIYFLKNVEICMDVEVWIRWYGFYKSSWDV